MSTFNIVEKIIFKKGVFEDLAEFAKKYKKIAILTSKTPKKLYFSALRGFLNEKNLDFIVYEFNDNLENYENSIKASASCKNCDLIVALGAGTISNFAKLVAKILNIPYVVAPSTISHFGYFTNYAYQTTSLTTEKISCDYPLKIFIDENIIKNSPENFIFSTCCFIFSFLETAFSELMKNKIFGTDNIYSINAIKTLINKTEGLTNWLNLKKEVAILNLMDNVIELFSIANELSCDIPTIDIACLMQNKNVKSNFGKQALINANTILTIYQSFWSEQNISYKNIPNYEFLVKILQKNGKNIDFFENFIKNYQNVTTNQFFFKIKTIKPILLSTIILTKNKISKLNKKILNLYCKNEVKYLNDDEYFNNIAYIALTSNCFHLNTMMRLGYLNFA